VLIATDGTAEGATERRTVVTGSTVGNETEITSGLQAGEQVLIEVTVPAGRTGNGEGGRTGEGGFPGGGGQGGGQFPGGGEGRQFPRGGQGDGQAPVAPSTTVAG